MKTAAEYRERIMALKPNVYMGGEVVSRNDPRFTPELNVLSLTFDLAQEPAYEGVMTATSHLTGERINRFCHIHHSVDDLLNKQKMTRQYVQKTGFCILRCMGIDAMNALSVVTHEMDQELGTEYNRRFLDYVQDFQKRDSVAAAAQTDVKGDRSKRPKEQADPDLYLRVVEKRRDGIVVRGAKNHITMAAHADEIIALPTRVMTEGEEDWAVAFAVPADTKGVYLVSRASSPRPRQSLPAPVADQGWADSFVIFDDVFVPWERVFMCGERQFAGRLALLFALFHRHSYCGCKPALTDVIMGMTALVAEYNGVEKANHVREKLAEMIGVAELVYAAGVAGSVNARPASSGTYVPDVIYCNVGRRHAGESTYHEMNILADIAGGLPATLPLEADYNNEKTGALLAKYIMRNPKIPAEYQQRCFRMVGDYLCSSWGGGWSVAAVHGGGSPIMETIAILGNYDLNAKKNIARRLAGIPEQ
ncbi:MAG: aromatic ring hydroxylase [Chloroflexi bacterium]|nr:aromatic ring hydroxylase [Chloroflexota bacterium]